MHVRFRFVLQACGLVAIAVILLGCSPPPPTTAAPPGPPPPPPIAAPAPPPAAPAPKAKADPYEVAVNEIAQVLQRYPTVYAGVRDAASADKAVEEIGRLTKRLGELAAEIAKLPHRPGQDKHTLKLQAELTRLQTAQLASPDMQRVLADPDLQITFLAAHQSFLIEGIGHLGTALLARRGGVLPEAVPAAPESAPKQLPAKQSPAKP